MLYDKLIKVVDGEREPVAVTIRVQTSANNKRQKHRTGIMRRPGDCQKYKKLLIGGHTNGNHPQNRRTDLF